MMFKVGDKNWVSVTRGQSGGPNGGSSGPQGFFSSHQERPSLGFPPRLSAAWRGPCPRKMGTDKPGCEYKTRCEQLDVSHVFKYFGNISDCKDQKINSYQRKAITPTALNRE